MARANGAHTLEPNLKLTELTQTFDEARHRPAMDLVPPWVNELLRAWVEDVTGLVVEQPGD